MGKPSDSIFFWISKLTWSILSPDTVILVLLLLSLALLLKGSGRPAKLLLGSAVTALTVIALFPVGEWLSSPLERRFPVNPGLPDRVDGIILLGGAEDIPLSSGWDQVEVGEAAERYLAFLSLARRYSGAKLVFSGGSGHLLFQKYKGADVARRLFNEQGLDLSRVIFERNSRNTYENAVLSKAEIRPLPGEEWVLITSAMHMPRSVGIFCRVGWPVIPYPVDHMMRPGNNLRIELNLARHLYDLKMISREWVGLLAYYITGKTSSLFPDSCSDLSQR
jgi:uncharacterized SAM-binding protein YcdF (DUF218 family)